ncbi:MAG: hypothetical protein PSX81_15190 [bacterium]|nr:hypothetical protein [bacterium]
MSKRIFWILAIGLHFLFLLMQLLGHTTMLQDTKEYLFAADNLIQYHQLYCNDFSAPLNPDYLTKRPFLYPAILAIFRLISFENNSIFLAIVLIIQNCVSLFNLKIMLKIVSHFKGDVNYLYAFILLIITPAQLIYANLIMTEIWLQFIILMLLNYFLFYRDSKKWQVYASILCIAGIALKPVIIFLALIFPALIIYFYYKKLNLRLIVISILPAIFVLLTIQWNAKRTGSYQYSAISTINLLHYNAYTLLIHEEGISKADSTIDDITKQSLQRASYSEQQKYKEKAAKSIIGNHIGAYTYLHLRGAFLCLLDPGRFDITQFFNLPHTQNLVYEASKKNNKLQLVKSFINPLGIVLIGLFACNIFKLIFGVKFIFSKHTKSLNKFLLLLFPLYIILITGPIGSSRFAIPFIPIYFAIILITLSRGKV